MTEKKKYRIMVSGGGTGGHIYPAIAIANAIKAQYPDTEFLFVGAEGRMEMEKVPEAGFPIEGLWISGLQRSLSADNLVFPFKVIFSILKSFKLLKKFKPDAVVGVGGYASAPLLYAASKKRIPTLIQEQNGYAGLTNKMLANKVDKICVAYEKMDRFFPREKLIMTGNPVRRDILNSVNKKLEGLSQFGLQDSKKTVLILGGSLGARTINQSIVDRIEDMLHEGVQVLWQTGKFYFEEMKEKVSHLDTPSLRIMPFIKEMDLAYSAADVVISRAGALSISELCLVGKPVVFVPSPNVAEDHQTKNAMALVEKDAALLVTDEDAPTDLIDETIALVKDEERQIRLGENIKTLARPDAARDIANEVIRLIK
ncbi:undecaprenyldiphospho-muramoylpentapeptide beta-N-acetylglucosaminyltransferase [Reichenbachiella versicolor]|uniref:undecaprenyldiphospho-muramoylpentapeptide beta-N-acetylglucosaminyltransferase n=1 Tax=Reichenbachiella versicolor TaxID=1821036 RepID=UPI000D6E7591|nr:undecaprenyldiphospho-muramoylpentapeptide beta-N-acetylglucosaminyltransferase [Reichenbachiella versicolor]